MSARLVLKVSGNTKWVKVGPEDLVLKVREQVEKELDEINTETVPRGETGALQKSMKKGYTPRGLTVTWTADHAKFVDKGTKASPGRYVPVLKARLVNKDIRGVRQRVYRLALKQGIKKEAAKAALFTPVHIQDPEHSVIMKGSELPLYVSAKELRDIYPSKYYGDKYNTSMHQKYGAAFIPRTVQGEERKVRVSHELWHAIQERAKVTGGPSGNRKGSKQDDLDEVGAYWAELEVQNDDNFKKKELSARGQIFKEALDQGVPRWEARMVYRVPMYEVPKEQLKTEGQFVPSSRGKHPLLPGSKGFERLTKKDAPRRGKGHIFIAQENKGAFRKKVERHELAHALDWRRGMKWGKGEEALLESRAHWFEGLASRQELNLGEHPGIKATNFSQKFATQLRQRAVTTTLEVIKESFR